MSVTTSGCLDYSVSRGYNFHKVETKTDEERRYYVSANLDSREWADQCIKEAVVA